MGLAVLPARLKTELQLMEEALLGKTDFASHECLEKHASWYEELKTMDITEDNVHDIVCQSVSEIFSRVLENAGVFKLDNPKALEAVMAFIEK